MIALASKKTRLLIYPEKESSVTISEDLSTLHFTSNDTANCFVNEVQLSLFMPSKIYDIHEPDSISLVVPVRKSGRRSSVRIDALLPMVFDSGEVVSSMCAKTFVLLPHCITDHIYGIFVSLHYGDEFCGMSPIRTSTLLAKGSSGELPIYVCKEFLALHSDYFFNLFYGTAGKKKKKQNSYKIDVTLNMEFLVFMKNLHQRSFTYNSVREATEDLALADRFRISVVIKPVIQFLKKSNTSFAELQDLMRFAARLPSGLDFARGLLSLCQSSPLNALTLVHSYASAMQNSNAEQLLSFRIVFADWLKKWRDSRRRDRRAEVQE